MEAEVMRLNPPALHANPAYAQAVSVRGPGTTVYVGGQNAVDGQGAIVARGDLKGQTRQALLNVQAAVEAAGGDLGHVVKWTVYVLAGQSAQAGFEAFGEVWGQRGEPPAISAAFVAGLAHPDFLVEIDAVAFVPD